MADALQGFLAAILRGEAQAWPPHDGGIDTDAVVSPDTVLESIRFHGIATLIAEHLTGDNSWPEDLAQSVREEAHLQAFWEESHRAMLTKVYRRLDAVGVTALVMKGTALAYSLYAEPSARRRGDTDLLVREEQLAQTRTVLQQCGFARRNDPQGLFFQETWLLDTGIGIIHPIDLHWQPNDSPVMQKVLRLEEYFADPVALPDLAPQALAPDRVLTFLQGSLNQAWHRAHGYLVEDECVIGEVRLIWAWDNHLLASSFSASQWDRLTTLAVDRGIAALVLPALESCRHYCASPVPQAVMAALQQAPQDTQVVRRLLRKDHIGSVLQDLGALDGLLAKTRFILGHALPSGDHLRLKYPQNASWPVPLLYIRRLAEIAARWKEVLPRR